MEKYLKYAFLIAAIILSAVSMSAQSADAILKKASSIINSSGGMTASFTMDYGSQKLTGTLKSAGKKFVLLTSASSTWYDGKDMWTYNPKSNETTLITPTASELAEANPLSLVNTYQASFTAALAKTQEKGCKTVVLTPKTKKTGYKSVHVTISASTSLPTKIVVIPMSGSKMSVTVSQVKLNQQLPQSTFVYPKTKYSKAEVVDLR